MKKCATQWTASDLSGERYLGPVEFQDNAGEWHDFEVVCTPSRVIFGGACNCGFLESGYMLREDGESLDQTLQEMLADLEALYNDDNPSARLVYNERV